MNMKIFAIAMLCFALGACAVKLEEKDAASDPIPFNELVVEESYHLPLQRNLLHQQVLQYDRLFLKRGARFITNGANIRLEIKELISEDALITTFEPDVVAKARTAGRHGGHLEIHIGKATGKLKIELRGEKGGEGAPGKSPDITLKGPPGNEGPSFSFLTGGGGLAGSPGGRGAPGFPGENGFSGGNSGSAYIKINDDKDFVLELSRLPGAGGSPGAGGQGGSGGDGGLGGLGINLMRHATGASGPQGPQGPSGAIGTIGLFERLCLQPKSGALVCE